MPIINFPFRSKCFALTCLGDSPFSRCANHNSPANTQPRGHQDGNTVSPPAPRRQLRRDSGSFRESILATRPDPGEEATLPLKEIFFSSPSCPGEAAASQVLGTETMCFGSPMLSRSSLKPLTHRQHPPQTTAGCWWGELRLERQDNPMGCPQEWGLSTA